jgi:hypothetical protein
MESAPSEGGARPADGPLAAPGLGVRSLIQGQAAGRPKHQVPRAYLFAGDALLIALALVTVYKSPHPLSVPREIFCVATVLLAALLAIIAIMTPENEAQPPSRAGAGVVPNGEPPKKFGNHKANATGAQQ